VNEPALSPSALALGAGTATAQPGGVVYSAETLPQEVVEAGGGPVVHYHFPVVVEVRATPEPADPHAVAEHALIGLARALRNS